MLNQGFLTPQITNRYNFRQYSMSITTSSLVRISSFFIVHPISLWYPQCILLPVGCAHFPTFFFPKPGTWRDEGDMKSNHRDIIEMMTLDGWPKDPQLFHPHFRAPPSLASSPWTLSSDSQCFEPTPGFASLWGLTWNKKWPRGNGDWWLPSKFLAVHSWR